MSFDISCKKLARVWRCMVVGHYGYKSSFGATNIMIYQRRDGLTDFSFSDKRGILYPYTPDPSNPGDTRMLREDELKTVGGEKKKEGVPAVLLQDILSSISSNTVILKLDVQGYECRVRSNNDCSRDDGTLRRV